MEHYAQYAIIVLVIAFGLYRRVRRTVGKQPLASGRLTFRLVLFSIIGVLVLLPGIFKPQLFIGDAAGLVIGGILAFYAIKHTTFENQNGKWTYRTHPVIGLIVIVLFIGRIIYRMFEYSSLMNNTGTAVSEAGGAQAAGTQMQYTGDPLTAGVLFILIAYYAGYYGFLLRQKKMLDREAESESNAD